LDELLIYLWMSLKPPLDMLHIDRQGFESAIEGLLSHGRLSENLEVFDKGRVAVHEL
jgi:hypothetical protein